MTFKRSIELAVPCRSRSSNLWALFSGDSPKWRKPLGTNHLSSQMNLRWVYIPMSLRQNSPCLSPEIFPTSSFLSFLDIRYVIKQIPAMGMYLIPSWSTPILAQRSNSFGSSWSLINSFASFAPNYLWLAEIWIDSQHDLAIYSIGPFSLTACLSTECVTEKY